MRAFLFGVDGLTFRVLHPMIERGLLPCFQRLRDGGVEGILKSTTPPVTPPAWTSMYTGLPPAKHGVYDFWDYEQTEHGLRAKVVTHRKGGKAIWNMLSECGKRVVIANVPMTYPPEPVNGVMLSGYMAPDLQAHVTYPASFKKKLLEAVPNYQIDLDPAISCGQIGDLGTEVLQMTRNRNKMMRLLLDEPWDFFFIAYMGADRIQHMRWDEIMRFGEKEVQYYQLLDESLGMALDAINPEEDLLMVVSDHGFQGAMRKFYVQEYLYRKGFLRMENEGARQRAELVGYVRTLIRNLKLQRPARSLFRQMRRKGVLGLEKEHHSARLPQLDWTRTHACIPSSSGALASYADIIFDDTVTDEQIDALLADLYTICDPESGQLLVNQAHREVVYGTGPFAPKERHLIIQTGENTTLPVELARPSLWETRSTHGRGVSSGVHHPDGVLYLYGAGVKRGVKIEPAHIYDVVPTILTRMQLPLHNELAGKYIEEAFELPVGTRMQAVSDSFVMKRLKKFALKIP